MRFLCALSHQNIPQEGNMVTILGYIGINSSILLVTAMSIDRFVAVVFPHFYRCKVQPKALVLSNIGIVVFSSIFAFLQLTDISMDVYRLIDQHLHATFPLSTSTLAYLGIFFVLKKQSRVDLQRQTAMPHNPTLHDMRRVKMAQMERKFATTSFFILLFLILSLLPYFVAVVTEINCRSCGNQNWFIALRELCVLFLFLNSAVNPFLTTFRINELKKSVRIVLRLRRQDEETNTDFRLPTGSLENNAISM